MLGWIYDAIVYPGQEVDGEAIMSVDTKLSSVTAVSEISVNFTDCRIRQLLNIE